MLEGYQFNLKQICPILINRNDAYFQYISDMHTFKDDSQDVLLVLNDKVSQDEKWLQTGSNFLAFFIFKTFLQESWVVSKDIEQYYSGNMIKLLRYADCLSKDTMNIVAQYWNLISRTLTFLQNRIKVYESYIPFYEVFYSDYEHNFRDTIPILGINKDDSVSLTFICQTDIEIAGSYIDVLRVPSICKIICALTKSGVDIKDISIIWLPYGEEFKFSRYIVSTYRCVKDKEFMDFINTKYNTNPNIPSSPNLRQCSSCHYLVYCMNKVKFSEFTRKLN